MKKLLSLLIVAGMVAFVACGPSQKEKDAKEKAKKDSIAAKKSADSAQAAEKLVHQRDSLRLDSIKTADKAKGNSNYNAAPTKKPTTPTTPTIKRPGATKKS